MGSAFITFYMLEFYRGLTKATAQQADDIGCGGALDHGVGHRDEDAGAVVR